MNKPLPLSMLAIVLLAAVFCPSVEAESFKLRGRGGCTGCPNCESAAKVTNDGEICDQCNSGAGCSSCRGRGNRRQRRRYDGQNPSANCGCNGSYNFPVAPLYTYHWPGLYAQTLMTDYQGPWRFPPIRAYTEDVKPEARRPVRQAGFDSTGNQRRSTSFRPMSERMKRFYR